MNHTPATFGGEAARGPGVDWDDAATLHRADDAGVLSALSTLRSGKLADLVRHVALLPEGERAAYVIQRLGDHRLDTVEIMDLYARPDFPHAKA